MVLVRKLRVRSVWFPNWKAGIFNYGKKIKANADATIGPGSGAAGIHTAWFTVTEVRPLMCMRAPRFPLKVFYDGSCIVCASEIEHYLRKDHGEKLVAINISSPDFDPLPYQISRADFMHQLHVIDQDEQVFTGVDSFWAIWQAFPASTVYGVMGRIIQLPGVNRLARIGYWLFARIRPYLPKRHQCESRTCSIHQKR